MMDENSRIKVRNILVNFACTILVFVAEQTLLAFIRVFQRGFYCNDDSISHPWKGDMIMPISVVYVVCYSLAIVTMLLNNYYQYGLNNGSTVSLSSCGIPRWALETCSTTSVFILGGGVSRLATRFFKLWFGQLRPNFLQICLPDVDCNQTENQDVYIQNYKCINTASHRVDSARMSFPSGQSLLAAYAMTYLILYLQFRCRFSDYKLCRICLQIICLKIVWDVSIKQIESYAHHSSDVFAGIVIGAIIAFVTMFSVADKDLKSTKIQQTIKIEPLV